MRSTCACPALLERIGKRKTMTDIDPKATLVRRFRIEGEVGKGGMGIVLKATDLETQTTVAVKYCHLNEPEALRRFAREVRVMATIKHQHVVLWTIGSRCHTHESTHEIPRYLRVDTVGVEIDVGDSQVDDFDDPQRVPEGHEYQDVIADPVARERLGGLEEAVNLFGV